MDPLILLLIGMAIVIGCILAFRMHAFLALSLAGIVVATITPMQNLRDYADYQVERKEAGNKGGWSQQQADSFLSDAQQKPAGERFA